MEEVVRVSDLRPGDRFKISFHGNVCMRVLPFKHQDYKGKIKYTATSENPLHAFVNGTPRYVIGARSNQFVKRYVYE